MKKTAAHRQKRAAVVLERQKQGFGQYRTKIVRQMRRQIFRQMKQKAE